MTAIAVAQEGLFGGIWVDNFAGGGGASSGIELALGITIAAAINHDPAAILMHKTNHPFTEHYQASVWDIDPKEVCRGRPVEGAWFSPDCFIAGTLVLTKEGYKPIEDIRVGDLVLTHKNRWRPVVETMVSQKEAMLVRGYGNSGMVCSLKHPFYVRKKDGEADFLQAKDLEKGMYWGIPTKIPDMVAPLFYEHPVDSNLMWLAGRYVGDGWLRMEERHYETVITCGKQDIDFLGMCLDAIGPDFKWNFREVRTGGQYTCCNRYLTEWLYENFGRLSEHKFIPTWLMGAGEHLIRAFLNGYLSADGCLCETNGNDQMETSTVSKKLAYGLVHMATALGKSVCVYRTAENTSVIEGRKVNAKPVYKIKWMTECDEKHRQTFVEGGIQWRPIRETTDLKNQLTFYNIGVDEDESYIAEGVIVHNCKHFSKAKGAALVDKRIRGLAWITLRWAGTVRPKVIFLENVEEFQSWGPVRKGKPVKKLAGTTFQKFIRQLQDLGYDVEWRELVAADYGAPTTRKRFVLIARCDGKPICWPERTHAPRDSEEVQSGKLLPWRSAAEIINWSLPCPSVFDSKAEIMEKFGLKAVRPLAPNTMRRVIRGVDKFTIKSGEPFIVPIGYGERPGQAPRVHDAGDPLPTVVSTCKHNVCKPLLAPVTVTNTSNSVGSTAGDPVHTVTTAGNQMLLTPSLMCIGQTGGGDRIRDVREPSPTTVSKQEACLLTPSLVQVNHGGAFRGQDCKSPMPTITAKHGHGIVAPSLIQYHTEQSEHVRASGLGGPINTVDASNRYGLTAANLVEYYGSADAGKSMDRPMPTVVSHDRDGVVAAHVVKFKGTNLGSSPADPMQTVTASAGKDRSCGGGTFAVCKVHLVKVDPEDNGSLGHWPEVRELLNQHCGYHLAEDELLLLEIGAGLYYIADIGLRMLTPRELYNAMGFPPDYIIDHDYTGNPYPKNEQVARCGNAVCPPMAAAVVRANFPERAEAVGDGPIQTMEKLMEMVAV